MNDSNNDARADFVRGADYSKDAIAREKVMQQLRDAHASDKGKPFPETPAALQVPLGWRNKELPSERIPSLVDAEDAAQEEAGGPSDGSTVDLELCDGTVVRVSGRIISTP